ncbi:MAG: aminotransferase class IV, partial [Kiloniellaceae bacterium]
EGITRQTAIELCGELGIPVVTEPVPIAALAAADEVFLTSTAGGIVGITRIDGRPVGDGRPGPLTRRLVDRYWAKHEHPAWTTAVPYIY